MTTCRYIKSCWNAFRKPRVFWKSTKFYLFSKNFWKDVKDVFKIFDVRDIETSLEHKGQLQSQRNRTGTSWATERPTEREKRFEGLPQHATTTPAVLLTNFMHFVNKNHVYIRQAEFTDFLFHFRSFHFIALSVNFYEKFEFWTLTFFEILIKLKM